MEDKYICPKCGSIKSTKEKIMGSDTQDRICNSCGFTGHYTDFLKNKDKNND